MHNPTINHQQLIEKLERKHLQPKQQQVPQRPKYTVIINTNAYEFDFITALEMAIKYNAWYLEPSSNNTIAHQSSLSKEQKSNILRQAKGGSWYDGWQPYCLACRTMTRLSDRPYGFQCTCCKNMIGFNLVRLAESPLNNHLTNNRYGYQLH